MKKGLCLLLAALMLLATMAGCAGKTAEDAPAQTKADSGSSGGKVSLEFYFQKSDVEQLMQEIVAKFEAENPDIDISLTVLPDSETALVSRIATNDYPDIISIWPAEVFYRDLMRDGVLMDLSSQEFMNQVSDSARAIAQYDGKDYAYSLSMSAYGLIINKDLFEQYNVSVPETWADLISAAKTFQDAGVTPFVFYDKSTEALSQQAERMSGILNNDITGKITAVGKGQTTWEQEPEMSKLADAMLELRQYCQPDTLGTDSSQGMNDMATGKAAMIIDGGWRVAQILKINPDANIEMVTLPNPDGENSIPASIDCALCISESCQNKEAALKFLEFVATPEIAQYYADNEKNPSVVKSVEYNVPEFEKIAEALNKGEFFFTPGVYWPAGFRNSWAPSVQNLIMTQDKDVFLKETDAVCVEYFANAE